MFSDTKQPALLVKPEAAARLLAVSPRTLWSLTRAGVVPCVRLGRSVRYSPDTLHAMVAGLERERVVGTIRSVETRQVELGVVNAAT